jgi:PadR family transcriptional regulator, regulatory protein PadR
MRRPSIETRRVLTIFLDAPREEIYGFELTRAAGLPSGTVYPILRRLEDAGWVSSRWETIDQSQEGRRRRRYYRLSEDGVREGRKAVAEQAQALRLLVPGWEAAQ